MIALYVAKNNRVSSPKFILGESYGGFRAAKVARAVQSEQGIVISGILMLSPMLEGAFQFGGGRFALGAALQLPSLAAAELERKGTFSKEALAQVEHFALTEYLSTLAGPPLQGEAAKNFYARVAQMTGLSMDVIAQTRGFIPDDYVKNLPIGDHKIVSQYDATFASDDPYPKSPPRTAPILSSTAWCVPTAAPSPPMRATSSATRPISPTRSSPRTCPANGSGARGRAAASPALPTICVCCWR